jgi:hypothetical protein
MRSFFDMLLEGERLEAFLAGFSNGIKTYKDKRKEQKTNGDKEKLKSRLLSAKGEELQKLIAQMIEKGYHLKNGEVEDRPREKTVRSWMLEGTRHVSSQRWHQFKESRSRRLGEPILLETRELVGNAQNPNHQPQRSKEMVRKHPF